MLKAETRPSECPIQRVLDRWSANVQVTWPASCTLTCMTPSIVVSVMRMIRSSTSRCNLEYHLLEGWHEIKDLVMVIHYRSGSICVWHIPFLQITAKAAFPVFLSHGIHAPYKIGVNNKLPQWKGQHQRPRQLASSCPAASPLLAVALGDSLRLQLSPIAAHPLVW